MSISHESVHEWWENQLNYSDKLNLANMINDQTILDKAYNELSQEQQDLVLNTYYQKQDYFNPNEEEELGVMSNHSDHGEDKGWSSYPAGTASFESKANEDYDYRSDAYPAPDSMDKPYDWWDGQGEFIIDTVKEDLYQSIKNAGYDGLHEFNMGGGEEWEVMKARQELEREGKIKKGSVYDKLFQTPDGSDLSSKYQQQSPYLYWFDSNIDFNRTGESIANEYDYYIEDMGIENGDYVDFGSYGKLYVINHGGMGVDRGRNLWVTDSEFDRDELILQDFDRDVQSKIEGWYISAGSAKKIIEKGDGSAVESKATEYNPMSFINKQLGIKTKAKEVSQKWLDELQITRDQLKRLLENDGETMSYVNGMSQDNFEDYVTHLRNEQGSWSQVINDAMSDESYANEDSYESPMLKKGQQYTKDSFVGFKGRNPTIAICTKCGWEAGELSDEFDSNAPIYDKVREHVASVHGLVQNNWAESYVRKVKYTGNEGISLADWSKYQDENGWYRVGVSSPTPEIEDIARSMGGNYYGISSDGYGVEEWSFHNYSDAENFAQYVEGKSTSYDYGDGNGLTPEEQHYVSGPQDVSPHIFTGDGQDINIGSGAIGGHPLRDNPFGVNEAIRGKYDSWKKQDIDVRDETLDFAGVNADIKEEILSTDMTLDEIKDGYPEEFKKLEQAGVWGFGESLTAGEQWSDEQWLSEVEKLASGSGVKTIPVENFLMTLEGQTKVQAEMNFESDASVYGWNGETQEAISKGISKYFSKESKANERSGFLEPSPILNVPVSNRQELWDREVERYDTQINFISSMPPYEKPSKYDFVGGAENEDIAEAVWNMKQALGESKANEDYLDDLGYDYAEPTYQQRMDARSVVSKNFSIVQKQTSVPEYSDNDWEYGGLDTFSEDYDIKCNICGRVFDTDADKNGVAEQHLRSEHSIDAFGVSHKQFTESKAKKQGKEYNLGKQSSDVYDIIIYDKETGDWEMSIDVDNQKDLTYYKDDFKQEANRLNDEAGYKKYAVKVKNEWDSLNWSQDFSEEKVKANESIEEHYQDWKSSISSAWLDKTEDNWIAYAKSMIGYSEDEAKDQWEKWHYLTKPINESKTKAKEVAEKLAYYFNKGDKPIDWNDNQVSNEAERILQETYGITTKKPEVAKEVAHESHSPIQEKIIDRKLSGVKSDGIVHELMLWENMSEEQATKAVESTEIPIMDSVSFSLFNKKYSQLTEVEKQEIKLYGGEVKKVNKSREGV